MPNHVHLDTSIPIHLFSNVHPKTSVSQSVWKSIMSRTMKVISLRKMIVTAVIALCEYEYNCTNMELVNIFSREEKVCKGQPCTTEAPEVFTTHQMEQISQCKPGWTVWLNQDKGSFTKTKKRTKKKEIEPLPTTTLLVSFMSVSTLVVSFMSLPYAFFAEQPQGI